MLQRINCFKISFQACAVHLLVLIFDAQKSNRKSLTMFKLQIPCNQKIKSERNQIILNKVFLYKFLGY
jgi:hypothetical protein